MKTRGIVGKKIKEIVQEKRSPDYGAGAVAHYVKYIVLEDGTRLAPVTLEMGGSYETTFRAERLHPCTECRKKFYAVQLEETIIGKKKMVLCPVCFDKYACVYCGELFPRKLLITQKSGGLSCHPCYDAEWDEQWDEEEAS